MKSWFKITALAASNTVEIDLTDEIGAYGITTQTFLDALRPHQGKDLTINVDCPGGSCEDGLSIYDAIGQFTGRITMNIIGTAASMASVIILAAEDRTIAENGRIMIHRVSAGIRGNPDQLQAATDLARQFEERIIGIYKAKLSLTEEDIRDKMKTEIGTWFFGEEAVKAGFATRSKTKTKARAFKAEWSPLFTMLPAALFDTTTQTTPNSDPLVTHDIPHMKAIHALASLVGLALKGDETEDQIVTACQAHKPAAPKFELNLEDPETVAHFQKLVDKTTQPLRDQITNLQALIKNGPAGSAGAGSPVPAPGPGEGKTKDQQITDLQAELTACKDPRERGKIITAIAKLRAA